MSLMFKKQKQKNKCFFVYQGGVAASTNSNVVCQDVVYYLD